MGRKKQESTYQMECCVSDSISSFVAADCRGNGIKMGASGISMNKKNLQKRVLPVFLLTVDELPGWLMQAEEAASRFTVVCIGEG